MTSPDPYVLDDFRDLWSHNIPDPAEAAAGSSFADVIYAKLEEMGEVGAKDFLRALALSREPMIVEHGGVIFELNLKMEDDLPVMYVRQQGKGAGYRLELKGAVLRATYRAGAGLVHLEARELEDDFNTRIIHVRGAVMAILNRFVPDFVNNGMITLDQINAKCGKILFERRESDHVTYSDLNESEYNTTIFGS